MAKHLLPTSLIGSLVLALALLTGSVIARADEATVQVAIDTNVAGNGDNVLGPTESCNATALQVGETIDVDVVVRGVPEATYDGAVYHDGIAGFEFNFLFDPTVVVVESVAAFNGPTILKGTPPVNPAVFLDFAAGTDEREPPPGTGGDVSLTMLDASISYEGGDGVLTRVSLKAVGEGVSRLGLQYSPTQSRWPMVYAATGIEYQVASSEASIAVGSESCLSETPQPFPTATPQAPHTVGPTPTAGGHFEVWLEPATISAAGEAEIFVKATADSPGIGYYVIVVKLSNSTFRTCGNASHCVHNSGLLEFSQFTGDPLVGDVTLGSLRLQAKGPGEVAELDSVDVYTPAFLRASPTIGNAEVTAYGTPAPTTAPPPGTATQRFRPTGTSTVNVTAPVTVAPTATATPTGSPSTLGATPSEFPRSGSSLGRSPFLAVVALAAGAAAIGVGFWLAKSQVR